MLVGVVADAKLSEYIKDKKNSRTTRDKFLADVGMVRAEVCPRLTRSL